MKQNHTHIIKNPAGTYSYVGHVPTALAEVIPAKYADIIGGRAFRDQDGRAMTHHFRPRESIQQAVDDAVAISAPLCDLVGCACRKLFRTA